MRLQSAAQAKFGRAGGMKGKGHIIKSEERTKAMTEREVINGKPYAGNSHVRFDEGEVASATPRRGSILYKNRQTFHRIAFAIMGALSTAQTLLGGNEWHVNNTALVAAQDAEPDTSTGWHLINSCKITFYDAKLNMMYWAKGSPSGEKGPQTVTLNAGEDYFVSGDRRFTTNGAGYIFPGSSLTIGDEFTSGILYIRGREQTYTNLVMRKGSLTHAMSRSSTDSVALYYNLYGSATVKSPKSDPFSVDSSDKNLWMTWSGKLIGDEEVGLSICPYSWNSGVLVSIVNAAEYYGDIVVTSGFVNVGRTFGAGLGVEGPIPGTVRIKGGSIIKPYSPTSVADLGELHMDAGTEMRFVYDSAAMTGGLIRVSNALTLPEKVIVHALSGVKNDGWNPPISKTGEEVRSPFLVGPPNVRIDPKIFELVPDPTYEPRNSNDYRPQRVPFETETDPDTGRDTVYAVIEPIVTTVKGQDVSAYSETKAIAEGSALTNAMFWSDGRVPHSNAHYVINHVILTPVINNLEYEFPGKSLLVYAGRLYVYGSGARYSIPDFRLSQQLCQWRSGGVTICGGKMHVCGTETGMCATGNRTLTVESEILGVGDLTLAGLGNGNTSDGRGYFNLKGFNTNWYGGISVVAPNNSDVDDWSKDYLTINLYDGRNLGGALREFDYDALTLGRYCMLQARTNATLDASVNRGIFLGHERGARIAVDEGYTLDCNWPITFNGPLYKVSAGTLALGGGVKFYDGTAVSDTLPEDPSKRLLVVTNGTLKALAHDCVNGLTVALANDEGANTSLALDFAEEDGDLKRYGFYNVKTDTPFEAEKPINIQLNGVDGDKLREWKEFKQGLVTVKTSAADTLKMDDLISFKKSSASGNPVMRLVREDNPEGVTTYSAYYKFVGTQIILR